jgi:hypothetical protein
MIAGRVHSMHHKLLASLVHKMHPTPDDTINILLIGVMGRYCRYGLTQ